MDLVATRLPRPWVILHREFAWVDLLSFLLVLFISGRVLGAYAVGALALGWSMGIVWFYLTDRPASDAEGYAQLLSLKGLSVILGAGFILLGGLILGKPLETIALISFGFMMKGLESVESLQGPPHTWLSWIRGPTLLILFWGIFILTHSPLYSALGALLSALAFLGGDQGPKMSLKGSKSMWSAHWSGHWDWVLALELGAFILLLPFFGLSHSYGLEDAGYFAIMGFWIFLGNWLFDRTRPHWGRRFKRALLEPSPQECFVRLLLASLGRAFGVTLLLILVSVFWGKEILFNLWGEDFIRYKDVLTWMIAAGGLFWVNAQLCMARGVLRSPGESLFFIGAWALVQLFLTLYFTYHLGIAGAAWSLFIVGALMIPVQWIFLDRSLRDKGFA